MLRNIKELTGYVLRARDGDIGRCKDFLFDDERWTVRYMVADTGRWLPKRRVLISPASIDDAAWDARKIDMRLTKDQIENAPPLEADAPITRQYEGAWAKHYGYAAYWVGTGVWGAGSVPAALYGPARSEAERLQPKLSGDPNLRSTNEVTGYHIAATDGEIGHIEDFIVDDRTWTLRYVVVDTRNWLPGKKVLVSPAWVQEVDWGNKSVAVDLPRKAIENGPKYDPHAPVNRRFEQRLYDFHGRPVYWGSEKRSGESAHA